ncbi:MAG: putative lipid II flippase FtsW [Patescibacteria group bacterium]|nr:putative lipid II flippase FtsW [Patescibacteria group bacterium]MDD5490702.1 putative lipid II flippase FtsW [Patescibacteria group bacterium]
MRERRPDYILIATIFGIVAFGLAMLSSASSALSYLNYGDSYFLFKHQLLFGFLFGTAAFIIFSKIDYHFWKKIAFPLLVITIVLLVAVFLPGIGREIKGASRWIFLGTFSFQPSELVKLTFLLYLATWLESRSSRGLADFSYGFMPFFFLLGIIMVLMILQPDVGTMSIIVLYSLAVYFLAGAAWSHVILLSGIGVVVLWLLVKIAPYRASRFMVFLNPELDPQGIGYHINQAFLAIGSGGFWGRGFGQSRQKFQYLPEVTTDSIFAVIAEELGFIFAALLVGAFLFFMYRGFKVAQNAPDLFGRIVAVGIVVWIVGQAFVNIASMIGIMPMTGVPLPFISYGSSSMVVSLAAAGILVNISSQAK